MLTPEQRARIEREESSWVREHIRGPARNAPGGFHRALDDLRHELIERPWFGREVTGNLVESQPHVHQSIYANRSSPWSQAPATGLDIHGNPLEATSDFYGGPQPRPPEAEPPAAGR